MDLRRLVSGSIVLGLALAGCGGSGEDRSARASNADARALAKAATSAPSSSAPSASPTTTSGVSPSDEGARAALAAAGRRLGDDSLRMRLDAGTLLSAGGSADPASGAMQMRLTVGGPQPMSLDFRVTGKTVYLKLGGELGRSMGNQWLRMKGAKIPGGLGLGNAQDPGDAQRLLRAVTQVRRDGPLGFRGTLDMSKSATANRQSLKALGDKARAIPFTARIDEQGRLVALTIRMDAANPGLPAMTVRYFDFGTPVAVLKPPGRIADAPKALVDAFNA